jgi:hypothetical protein
MNRSSTFVGITVSTTHLHINHYPAETHYVRPYTTAALDQLVVQLRQLGPTAIAVDSMGGDQWPVVRACI